MTNSLKLIPALLVCLAACGSDNRGTAATRTDTTAAPADSATAATPSAPVKKAPAVMRGIYLNAYAAGSQKRLAALLKMADETEINTFIIDVKDEKGMRYRTELAEPKAVGGEVTIGNLKALVDTLHAHNIWTSARIVVFKDPLLSKAKPEWSIRNPSGGLWMDKAGNTWVSAWDPNVWEYNIQIAEEVLKAGFDEIQFDYVRFPEPFPSLPKQIHPNAKGDRTDAIVEFLGKARPRIHALGGVLAADLFGLSPNDPADIQIGQQWERLLVAADHILPMTYPSHYLPTHLKGVPKPNTMPYETIVASVGMGVVRANKLEEAGLKPARVIPWLQAFSAPWVTKNYPYGPEQAAAQIRGVYDVGLEDWVFWHPGSKYELVSAAFEKGEAQSRAKKYDPPADMLSQVELVDRMGAKTSRERVIAEHRKQP